MITLVVDVADRFGVNPKEAERFFKFAVVGAVGFVVDFGIFNLLLSPLELLFTGASGTQEALAQLGLSLTQLETLATTLAGTISFVAAIISNFLWNRYWTYPDSRSKSVRRQFAMFSLVSVAGIFIRVPLIALTHRPFSALAANIAQLAPYAKRVGDNLALILAVIVVMFWNFFVNRYWTYNDVD